MDGWNTSFLLRWPIFRCELLVSGRVNFARCEVTVCGAEKKQHPSGFLQVTSQKFKRLAIGLKA